MSKTLVAYFSASGETARLAKTLAQAAGGDLYAIVPEQAYTSADLNWNDKHSRSSLEMNDPASRPAIAGKVPDMGGYDFSGKTVIPFATSGGSGMGRTVDVLKGVCPVARFLPGKRLDSDASAEEVTAWVKSLGV